jgi:GAF domain-containing protein
MDSQAEQALMDAVDSIVASAVDKKIRAQQIADQVRDCTRRRWVGIYLIEADKACNLAWGGPSAPAYPVFHVWQGLTAAAVTSKETVICNDVANDSRYLTALKSTGSEVVVPVIVDGIVVGTLDVEDERTNAFNGDDQRLFEALALRLRNFYR